MSDLIYETYDGTVKIVKDNLIDVTLDITRVSDTANFMYYLIATEKTGSGCTQVFSKEENAFSHYQQLLAIVKENNKSVENSDGI